MCEPVSVAKTGLSVGEHQRRTVDNFVRLRQFAPDLPIIPVLQGWRIGDYLRCADDYAGIDLTYESLADPSPSGRGPYDFLPKMALISSTAIFRRSGSRV